MKILFLSFTCEDIGIAMVTNMISQLLPLFLLYNFISEFHNIFVIGDHINVREDKIRIPARPCNILYFSADFKLKIFLYYYYIIAYDISVLEYIGVSITVSSGFLHFVG